MYINNNIKSLIFLLLTIVSVNVFGQNSSSDREDDKRVEAVEEAYSYILNANDEGLGEDDLELIYLALLEYSEHPININQSNLSDLQIELEQTRLLSPPQVMSLIQHRQSNGKFMTKYELQTLAGWDLQLIKRVMPFLSDPNNIDATHIPFKDILASGKHTITLRTEYQLEKEDGYDDLGSDSLNQAAINSNKQYLGTRPKFYTRYNFSNGNRISFGFTGEKDRGEEFFKGTQKFGKDSTGRFNMGYDFFSYHLYLGEVGKIGKTGINVKKIALGDYNAAFGQGLTYYSGYGAFKSPASPVEVSAKARGISKYAGSGDFFMRGGATTLEYKDVELTGFYSTRNVDAKLKANTDSLSDEDLIDASIAAVFHNTASTYEEKGALNEQIYGGNLKYKMKRLTLSATLAKTQLSNKLARSSSNISNTKFRFNKSGSDNLLNLGLDYTYLYKNMTFFGEFSRSSQESDTITPGYAMLHGVMASIAPNFSISMVYRNLGLKYQHQAEKAEALTHNSSNKNNENSIYIGTSARLHKKVIFNSYIENAHYPWTNFADFRTNNFSVSRTEFSNQLIYTVKRRWEIYARYRNRVYEQQNRAFTSSDAPRVASRYNQFRLNSKYSPGNGFSMASRGELITNRVEDFSNKFGYVLYQDVTWKNSNWRSPFKALYVHYALFGGGDKFNANSSGIPTYTYERGVAFGLTPGSFGSGSRIVIMAKFQIIRGMKFNILFSETYRSDRDNYRDGKPGDIDYIPQPHLRRVDAQLLYKF